MVWWQGHFSDAKHDCDIMLENNLLDNRFDEALTMTIDGVDFCGMDFCDWSVRDMTSLEHAEERFQLIKWGSRDLGYQYDLQRFRLSVAIPVIAVESTSGKNLLAMLEFALEHLPANNDDDNGLYFCDDKPVSRDQVVCQYFQLRIKEECFAAKYPKVDFDQSLQQICREFRGKYYLRNCFGCLYSDYSPLGRDNFGSMLCFLGVADDYLKIKGFGDEENYWRIYSHGKQRQEVFLCKAFQKRIKNNGGYRGNIY